MNIFSNIKKATVSNAHGEVNFVRIEEGAVPFDKMRKVSPTEGTYIVGHSESGHHHVLEADDVTLRETESEGMKILYAIVENPVSLRQKAGGNAHAEQIIEPGHYIVTNNREYNPFLKQARRVAD